MMRVIKGCYLELRKMNDNEWKEYVRQIIAADEFYFQYGTNMDEKLLECIQTMNPDVVYYSVYLKGKNILIGYVGITPETENLEIYVFRKYRRRGYGTEAIRMFCDAYFTEDITGQEETCVIAETLRKNEVSMMLLEKVGFQREAIGMKIDFGVNDDDYQMIGVCRYYRQSEKLCVAV